jgi:hypothetical protein
MMVRTPARLGALLVLAGCGAATPFHPSAPSFEVAAATPLGTGYVLLPRSNDDRSLLGRVLADPPSDGRPLDEVTRPNPCADKLGAPNEEPVVSSFEDTVALASRGKAQVLHPFGFDEDAPSATHFYYKLDVDKRASVAITPEYTACCTEKGTCGYGVVTALGRGQGEFAVVAEQRAGGASIQIADSSEDRGFVDARFLRKRYVYGYIAALVTVTDAAKAKPLGLLGDPAAGAAEPTEQDLPEQARAEYERKKIQVVARSGAQAEFAYAFKDGSGAMSENELVRRYEDLTGARDLSAAKRNRNPFWLYYGIAATGVGAFLVGTALYVGNATQQRTEIFPNGEPMAGTLSSSCNFSTGQNVPMEGYQIQCSDPINPGLGKTMGITGAAVLGTGLVSFVVYGVLGYDGSSGEHVITKADADTYAGRYNRALLRGAARGTLPAATPPPPVSGQDLAPQVLLIPVVSPAFTGVVGRF